jgi:hypothetical protein
VETCNKNGGLNSESQPALQQSLLRATKAFDAFLLFITQKLFSKGEGADRKIASPNLKNNTEATFQVPGGRVSRTAWFFYEKEVVKYRDSLREARGSLHFALTLAQMYAPL